MDGALKQHTKYQFIYQMGEAKKVDLLTPEGKWIGMEKFNDQWKLEHIIKAQGEYSILVNTAETNSSTYAAKFQCS